VRPGRVEPLAFVSSRHVAGMVRPRRHFYCGVMSAVISVPVDWIKSVGDLRLPASPRCVGGSFGFLPTVCKASARTREKPFAWFREGFEFLTLGFTQMPLVVAVDQLSQALIGLGRPANARLDAASNASCIRVCRIRLLTSSTSFRESRAARTLSPILRWLPRLQSVQARSTG
jgi:hypothetical protein